MITKRLSIGLVVALLSSIAFATNPVTSVTKATEITSVSTATAEAGPGNGTAHAVTSGVQYAAASGAVSGNGHIESVRTATGTTVAEGYSVSNVVTTGTGHAAATTSGNSAAYVASKFGPVGTSNGVSGAAYSGNSNITAVEARGNSTAGAAQASGNTSYFSGTTTVQNGAAITGANAISVSNGITLAPVATGDWASAAAGALTNTGGATVTGAASAHSGTFPQ
jgi:hypothetical protein